MSIAFGTFGCTGQKLEGRWFGNLPLEDAKACSVELHNNGRFTLYCPKGEWAGWGRFEDGADTLRLNFDLLARRGKKLEHPVPLDFRFVGRGNRLDLRWNDAPYQWERKL